MGSQAPQRPPNGGTPSHLRPISPPPPPPFRLVTVTPASVSKQGQNPDNASDARPAPPKGSGGQSSALAINAEFARAYKDAVFLGQGFLRLSNYPNGLVVERLDPMDVTVRKAR